MKIFNLAEELEKERKKNKELEEEHKNCTRKHWQEKCAEHCANERILQCRIDKAIEYIEEYKEEGMGEEWFRSSTPVSYLLNILKGSDNNDK